MKMWQILALIFPANLHGLVYAVEFEPCFPAVKNEPCNMTCQIPNFSQVIEFTCSSARRGTCSVASCVGMIKEGNTKLHLQIPSIAYANDDCEWGCTYGANASLLSNITIYSGISGTLNLTSQENEDGVKLTAVAECLHPYNPIVHVEYSEADTGPYASLNAQVDLQSSATPGGCSDVIERRVTAVSDVSAKHEVLAGKSVFFKMKFSQYPSGPDVLTNPTGPFSFNDCSLDIFLYGFLPVFLIVLIVSIAIIIILKIERLPQQFGELAWKKLVIIAICFVVAIIIGVCLGLLIKGCDKKYLALGLSLLFGILIVVTLIFALIYYHKKCESRREIQDGSDGGAQDGNGKSPKKTGSTTNKNTREKTGESKNNTGSNTTKNATERGGNSQNNTGSNATKTATERVGSPASTSNIELAANVKSEY